MVWPFSLDRTLPFAAPSSTNLCAATTPNHLTVPLPSPQGIVKVDVLSPNLITALTFRPRALLGLPGLWGLPGAAGMAAGCCAARDSGSAAQPSRRGPGLPRPPRRLALWCLFARRRRSAERDEAQRRVVSNWEARWTRGGFLYHRSVRGSHRPAVEGWRLVVLRRRSTSCAAFLPTPGVQRPRAPACKTTATAWSRSAVASDADGRGRLAADGWRGSRAKLVASVSNLGLSLIARR